MVKWEPLGCLFKYESYTLTKRALQVLVAQKERIFLIEFLKEKIKQIECHWIDLSIPSHKISYRGFKF